MHEPAVPELKNRENESPEVSCVRRLNMVGEKQEPNWNEWNGSECAVGNSDDVKCAQGQRGK